MSALFGKRMITLDEAKKGNLPMFRAVCKHKHTSWRYVKTPLICLECVIVARLKAKAAHPPHKPVTVAYPIDSSFPSGMTLEIATALGLPLDKLY